MDLAALVPTILKASIVAIVLGLGLQANGQAALSLFRRPGEALRSALAMFVVMPVAAIALAQNLLLPAAIKIALVALSVSPVPPILPKKQLKAGGSEEYSIGLLVFGALLAIVVIPLALELVERRFSVPLQMTAASITKVVASTVLAPLAVGMLLRRMAPGFAARLSKPLSVIGTLVLVAGAVLILVAVWPAIRSLIGNGTVLVFAGFALVGLAAGHFLARGSPGHRRVLALSTACRHPGVAMAIAAANFPGEKMVPAAILLYVLVSALVTTPYVSWMKRRPVTA
jgi:BASS family bile acid:Na+ symporter